MELLFASIPITPINATIVFIVVVPFGTGTAHQCEHSHQHEWCSTRPRHWRSLQQISSKKSSTLYVAPTGLLFHSQRSVIESQLHVAAKIGIPTSPRPSSVHLIGSHRTYIRRARRAVLGTYMRTATLVVVLGFSICAQSEPVELTAKNFDKKVFSTKSALVKFQAPW
jgi:hypothetical protein